MIATRAVPRTARQRHPAVRIAPPSASSVPPLQPGTHALGLQGELHPGLQAKPPPSSAFALRGSTTHRVALAMERNRFARELHDGLLQAVAGAAIQLETAARLIDSDPVAATTRVREIGAFLREQQRELRRWIGRLGMAISQVPPETSNLRASLDHIRRRAAWQHGIAIDVTITGGDVVPAPIAGDVCRIVEEGLSNVGKHAKARAAQVHVRISSRAVCIRVRDDGVGFPYRGRYVLADLIDRQMGPVSLRERVADVGGDMVLTTGGSGSRLFFALPLTPD